MVQENRRVAPGMAVGRGYERDAAVKVGVVVPGDELRDPRASLVERRKGRSRFDTTAGVVAGRGDERGADAGRVEEGGGDAGCLDVPTAVFVPKCATAGCHSTTDKAQGLDLQSADVAARLVDPYVAGGALDEIGDGKLALAWFM